MSNIEREQHNFTKLAINVFRATQAEEKLKRENIQSKAKANKAHNEVSKKVRQTIKELGGNCIYWLNGREISTALLVQQKLFSSKRFIKKLGKINTNDFENLKQKLYNLIFDDDFCPSKNEGTIPKENCI